MQPQAFFSCEASLKVGTGHVMRCLVIAEELKKHNWQCSFVTSKTSQNLIPKLQEFTCTNPDLFWNNPQPHDLLVVDNYSLNADYENHFSSYSKKILVIDDLADRKHNCHILLDQTPGVSAKTYQGLVNADCLIITGLEYCLLRSEFSMMRTTALEKRTKTTSIKTILVNFGGSDINNHTLQALEMIEASDFYGKIEVVLGFSTPNFESITTFSQHSKNQIIIHKQANMAQMIFEADMAVAAGGGSAWERCCLGLPTYLIKIADNQEKIFQTLGTKLTFNQFYHDLSKNYSHYVNQITHYVDGKGPSRLISVLVT